jgi:uncharacterized membrane protein YczE
VSVTDVAPVASRWRAGPRRLADLVGGCWLFGMGEGLVVGAALGNSPWSVLAQGVAKQTPLTVGTATIVISLVVILCWAPLRQRPGLGTFTNAVVVGVAIDVTLLVLPGDAPLVVQAFEVLAGIALVALGSGLYLPAALGPGPRDGLMVGLHRRTGTPIGAVRTVIELSALTAGALLGGRFGAGTIAFALLVGPAVSRVLALRGTDVRGL